MNEFDNFIYIFGFIFWMFSKSSLGEAGGILVFVFGLCLEYGVLK